LNNYDVNMSRWLLSKG